jgi:hypothetical protein
MVEQFSSKWMDMLQIVCVNEYRFVSFYMFI